MKQALFLSLFLGMASVLTRCGGDTPAQPDTPNPAPPATTKKQIRINASAQATRVSDNSFDNGDRIGLFVVNYSGSTPGSLSLKGNHADNVPFRYNGSWAADSPLYWKDDDTMADFYLYYPYAPTLSSVSSIPFEVKSDQSTEQNYKASELLAGQTLKVAPTENTVNITARHLMSRIEIILEAGDGFKSSDLTPAQVKVKVNDVKTNASLDLTKASVSASGDKTAIAPLFSNNTYRALLPPQDVAETNLITVTVADRDYNLKKAFSFESGKVHRFTVRLSRTSSGVNVNIAPWEDDGVDNGGVAE